MNCIMKKFGDVGLGFENGFPEYFHTLNNGVFTVDVGRTGGIDSLGFVDVRIFENMIYPNRWVHRLLSRKKCHMNRPMYGPAVKFLSVDRTGSVFYHRPEKGRLLPYGFISEQAASTCNTNSYHLFLNRDRTLYACFENHSASFKKLLILISKYHLNDGPFQTRQNQLMNHEYGVEMLSSEQLESAYHQGKPFQDFPGELHWSKISFDNTRNAFIFEGLREYKDGTKRNLFMLFSMSERCHFFETPQQWCLECPWNAIDGMAVSIAVRDHLPQTAESPWISKKQTEEQLVELLNCSRYHEETSPTMTLSHLPEASDFARVVRDFQTALLINGGEKHLAILAAAGKYGYFPAWDHNYPIRDFITTGDFKSARCLLRYALDYPYTRTVAFSISQVVLEVNELLSFEGSTDFLHEIWSKLLAEFCFLEKYVDKESGLLKAAHCCGVDNPAEVGLSRFFYAACINSWYFAALRTMENFAVVMHDGKTAEIMRKHAEKLYQNFLHYFFNRETGTLRVAVNEDFSIPRIEVFHNSSTIGLDYPYGEYLLHDVIAKLAAYKKQKLRHPFGYSAIAYDSASPCEMWHSVYMNQHLGHDTLTARLAGDGKEALRGARYYFQQFECCKTAIETFNLDGCNDDVFQRTAWQAFSATGALHCLHQSLIGIAWSRGGLFYIPAQDEQTIELKNFHFGNTVYHITVHGGGPYVKTMVINGLEIVGSMQLPSDVANDGERHLEICRSKTPWRLPVLLHIIDIPIKNLKILDQGIEFTVVSGGHAPLKFYAPCRVSIQVNGSEIPVEYQKEMHIAWADWFFQAGDRIECEIASTSKHNNKADHYEESK